MFRDKNLACIISACRTHAKNDILGAMRTSGFEEFVRDSRIQALLRNFELGNIKSVSELHREIQKFMKINRRTLDSYLDSYKKVSDAPAIPAESSLKIVRGLSKFNKDIVIAGNEGKYDWRKFRIRREKGNLIYFTCVSCENFGGPEIAKISMLGGVIENKPVVHSRNCPGASYANLIAEKIDRQSRQNAVRMPKMSWRKGFQECQMEDAKAGVSSSDPESLTLNYPDWAAARYGYNRRRQMNNEHFTNPYDLPKSLQVTRYGALRIQMGKELDESFRWLLHSSASLGVIVFASQAQIKMATQCGIIVFDGTFAVAPLGFLQLLTVHGFYSRENDADGEGEWTCLAWSLMERRKPLDRCSGPIVVLNHPKFEFN